MKLSMPVIKFKSVFFKLIISFLAVTIAAGSISFLLTTAIHRFSMERIQSDMIRRMDDDIVRGITLSGKTAWKLYKYSGVREYKSFVEEIATSTGSRIYLLDRDRRPLDGSALTEEEAKLIGNVVDENPVIVKAENTIRFARFLHDKESKEVILVGSRDIHPPPFGPGLPPPPGPDHFFLSGPGGFIRIAIFFLTASIVCYLLARSLTRPIRRLQRITQRIGEGDLSARFGLNAKGISNEIDALGRDFDIMAEKTEKMIKTQKRLLRDISHELRSPLTRLNIALELIRKGYDQESGLMQIERESGRIDSLVGELLTLARLENFVLKDRGDGETFVISELVQKIVADVNFEISGKDRRVVISRCDRAWVTGSREHLSRALENVIRNSAYYTAVDTDVEVALICNEKDIEIKVRDHGPGVPEEDLSNMFLPFYRVEEARERNSGGTGLGLAIAKQAIQVHEGEIRATNSRPPGGLITTIILPKFKENPE